ncbi:MAG: HesA/MoeB/ThiF family protein [Bacteroidales bacterium]|nr:HesA/MoeB/ThiF family protein [Bacteroidales bacterium]
MSSEILTEREIRLFSKQIKLPSVGIPGQEKIKKSRILIIGAGGKGSAVLQNLAVTGVGFIGISDNSFVGEENISIQRLYGDADLGKQKAIISRQRIRQIANSVMYEVHNICLSPDNIFKIIDSYDIIVDATDNFDVHYLINDAAVSLKKPVVFGSVFHMFGMVSVFNFNDGPSFRCLFPKKPDKAKSPGDEGIFAPGLLYNITGTIMANEVLAIILGHHVNLSGQLLTFKITDYSIKIEPVVRKPEN